MSGDQGAISAFDAMREALDRAASIDEVRLCEAKAAAIYWNTWSTVPIRLRGRDLTRVPVKWTRYDTRASALTNGPRAATNPVNALLNYAFGVGGAPRTTRTGARSNARRPACGSAQPRFARARRHGASARGR
jgi:CRISPR associated protein Cas1